MMKKTICFLFVLALIAQISARPDGKPGDKDAADKKAEKDVKGAANTGKDGVEKTKNDMETAAKDVKGKLNDDNDADADDDDDKKEEKIKAAEAHAAAEHAKKAKQGKHHKMGDIIRGTEAIGERFIKKGTDVMASMIDEMF